MARRMLKSVFGLAVGLGLVLASPAMAEPTVFAAASMKTALDEVASACNLSRGTFLRSFRETTGKTPHQWLTQQRVEKARALLLDSTMPLSEVASACGFSDQSHFTRVFSVATGATPGVWRRSRLS